MEKVNVKKQQGKIKFLKRKEKELKSKLNKFTEKGERIKDQLKDQHAAYDKVDVNSDEGIKLHQKIAELTTESQKLEKNLKILIADKKKTKLSLQNETKRFAALKADIKKNKADRECNKLKEELRQELLQAKKLKAKFRKECQKAVKVVTQSHICRIARLQKRMEILQKKIEKTKSKLANAPKAHKIIIKQQVKKMKVKNKKIILYRLN